MRKSHFGGEEFQDIAHGRSYTAQALTKSDVRPWPGYAFSIREGTTLIWNRIGLVVGMQSEARIAKRARNGVVGIGGGLPAGARQAAERLVDEGATALISFGLAGGLDPALMPGALLVPASVLFDGRRFHAHPRTMNALSGLRVRTLLAGEAIVGTAAEKARLWHETGASAVDLESGVVAEVAEERGLPFAMLRAVCDSATRDLPPAAVEALDSQGRVAPMKMAGILARHPHQILQLIGLGRDAARARKALVGGAENLGRLGRAAAGDAHLGVLL
jgi:adenosylhomocysteine nucleosidase